MKKIIIFLFFTALTPLSAFANSCVQDGNVIGMVGMDSGDNNSTNFFVSFSATNNQCGCSYVRFREAEVSNKVNLLSMFKLLTDAKKVGGQVRVDIKTSGDCDSAYRAYWM